VEDGLHPLHAQAADAAAVGEQVARPPVTDERVVRRDGGAPYLRLPVPARPGIHALGATDLHDPLPEVLLARDVVVERHRLDAELPAEAAHAERSDPVPIRDRNRCLEHALPVERRARRGSLRGPGCHRLTDLTLYVYLTA
jgi:hypothetical protein